MIRALIFDFDGTLVDTESAEMTMWNEIFDHYGIVAPEGYWDTIIGRGAEQDVERPPKLIYRLTGVRLDSEEQQQSRFRRIMELLQDVPTRPGILELLEEAKSLGMPVAIASSSKDKWVGPLVAARNLNHYFVTMCTADQVERAKPFPDLYLLACERLGVAPNEALAFEDSANGVEAAVAAGVPVIATPNSATAHMDFSKARCRLDSLVGTTIRDLAQLASV